MMTTYTLKVSDIKQETVDTKTICFKQPGLKKIKYKAGQYLTLIFRINGRRYIRPYSFSSAPSVDNALEVTVKRISGGVVSNHIHDIVQVGDSIEVLAPMGEFTLNADISNLNHVFLWGVGSGITPLISIAKDILAEQPHVQINLIYGNRSYESTIFRSLIQKYEVEFATRFRAYHFFTELSVSASNPFVIQGRINKTSIRTILEDVGYDRSLHFICGPTGLKESVKEGLSALQIQPDQIFTEDFELVRDPMDFELVHTQNIKLGFGSNIYTVEVPKGKSILESALDAGIELPYSCQTGNCSTCVAKLKDGSLKMIGIENAREDLSSDEFLLCCSHPMSNDVYIEV